MTINCPGRVIDILYSVYEATFAVPTTQPAAVVTSRVRNECQGKESCSISVGIDFFGFDPDTTKDNKLIVVYNCAYYGISYARQLDSALGSGIAARAASVAPQLEPYPVIHSHFMQGSTSNTISCPGGAIDIDYAIYVRADDFSAPAIVTSRMREHCHGKESCTFTVGDTFFGFDPYVGQTKIAGTAHRCVYYGTSYTRALGLLGY